MPNTPIREIVFALCGSLAAALVVISCGGGDNTATPPQATSAARPTAPAPAASPTAAPATAVPPTAAPATPARPTAVPASTPTAVPATPTAAGPQPVYGGILNIRAIREWASWDTYHAADAFSAQNVINMLSNLTAFDYDDIDTIVPDAAERWEVSQDGKSVSFFLRKDVKFSDGRPFTAADVLYNMNRAWKGEAPITYNKFAFRNVSDIQKADDYTLRLTLSRASAQFMELVSTPFVLMYPAHVPDMKQWKTEPVGTGPFKFKRWQQDTILELARNPGYYKKDRAGRSLPYLDGINIYPIASPANAVAAFRAGRLHCGCSYDNDFLTESKVTLEKEIPGVKLTSTMGAQYSLYFNTSKAPFNNRLVREAFSAAVDRRELTTLVRGGLGRFPPANLRPPELGGRWGLPDAQTLTFPGFRDPAVDKAHSERLFREAGVDPKSLTVDLLNTTFFQPIVEALQAQLAKTGANVKARAVDTTIHNADLENRRFDISFSTGGGDQPGPQAVLQWVVAGGVRNRGNVVSSPEIERLAAEQDLTLDQAKRLEQVRELQRILIREALFVPSVYIGTVYGTRPEVEGYVPTKGTVGVQMRLERLWLKS